MLCYRGMDMDRVAHDAVGRVRVHQVDIHVHKLRSIRCHHGRTQEPIRCRVDDNFDEALGFPALDRLAAVTHLNPRHLYLGVCLPRFLLRHSHAANLGIREDRVWNDAFGGA